MRTTTEKRAELRTLADSSRGHVPYVAISHDGFLALLDDLDDALSELDRALYRGAAGCTYCGRVKGISRHAPACPGALLDAAGRGG